MLKLQTDTDPRTGTKVLTCYLLPQRDSPVDELQTTVDGEPMRAGFVGGPKVL